MFDNLREQANSSSFEEEAQFHEAASASGNVSRSRSSGRILGMTAPQRFFISLMLMATVCILGVLVLLVTGKFGF
jgi:hypothetical protein